MKIVRIIARWLLGFIFIFSGFVKAVDPLGTAYKIEDYFIAFGTQWAVPSAVLLAVLLCVVELSLGFFLIFNIFKRFTIWVVALMMLFFTLLTLNDAVYNPVPDCGCFGDFLILTNWQTFYKNLFIDVLIIPIFICRNKYFSIYKRSTEWMMGIVIVVVSTLFTTYNLNHLPIIDFRDWKVGKKMTLENPQALEYYLLYQNKSTGEEKEYLSPNYPFNDSAWLEQWEYKDMRISDPNQYPTHLQFFDLLGNNITHELFGDPLYRFLLVAYDVDAGDWVRIEEIKRLKDKVEDAGYHFNVVTASSEERIAVFQKESGLYCSYLQSDDIDLKTIVRANPGLIVLKDGVIIGKWATAYFPSFENIVKETKFN